MLTYKFPEGRDVTQEELEDFKKHQQMAFVAARGFNVAYELIGNLRKADWYNQVSLSDITIPDNSNSRNKNQQHWLVLSVQFRRAVQAPQAHDHESIRRVRNRQGHDRSHPSMQGCL